MHVGHLFWDVIPRNRREDRGGRRGKGKVNPTGFG